YAASERSQLRDTDTRPQPQRAASCLHMNRSGECAAQASVSSSAAMRRWGRPRTDAILFIDLTKAIIKMQRERGGRIRRPKARTLDLPPPFRLVMLREVGDAFAHAC